MNNKVTLSPTKTTYGQHMYEILERTAATLKDDENLKEKLRMAEECLRRKEEDVYDPLGAAAALRGPIDSLYKKGYPRSLHDLCNDK